MNALKKVIALFLAVLLLFATLYAASAVTDVPSQTLTKNIATGSNYTLMATLIIEGGYTEYSSVFSGWIQHGYGTQSNYLCTTTQSRSKSASSPVGEGTYGSAFQELAAQANLYSSTQSSVTRTMIAGYYYYVPASYSSGKYDFRVAFPGAKLYENVDLYSSNGVSSYYQRTVTFAPHYTYAKIVPHRISD